MSTPYNPFPNRLRPQTNIHSSARSAAPRTRARLPRRPRKAPPPVTVRYVTVTPVTHKSQPSPGLTTGAFFYLCVSAGTEPGGKVGVRQFAPRPLRRDKLRPFVASPGGRAMDDPLQLSKNIVAQAPKRSDASGPIRLTAWLVVGLDRRSHSTRTD
jgi:hypothetical protein